MPPLDFPDHPSPGDYYISGRHSYRWDSFKWVNAYTSMSVTPSYVINVKDYGAKGDGVTNDAAAFASALSAAASGGHIVVPSGTYNIASALSQSITGGVSFIGAGSGTTMLSFSGATDGLTFTLSPAANVHVSGLTIQRTATGAAYANTGLSLLCPSPQAQRYGISTVTDVELLGNAARTTAWLTGVIIQNISVSSLDHVHVYMPDANNSGTGTGIWITGLSGSSYTSDVTVDNVFTQGGSNGLLLTDWIQGIYVTQSLFIGCDYGINWQGVSGHAPGLLAVSNTHCNASTRGIYAANGDSYLITNSKFLRFGSTSRDGNWSGIDIEVANQGLLANNTISNASAAGFPGIEVGIRLYSCQDCTVIGNVIRTNSAGIVLDTTTRTTVVGNVGELTAGAPMITQTPFSASNQTLINQNNGVYDIGSDSAGRVLFGVGIVRANLPVNAVNDAAAASAGVQVGGEYLNGSALMVRRA